MKLNLPSVTLIAMGSVDITGMANALEVSSEEINFGAVKLVSHKCPRFTNTSRKNTIRFDYVAPITSINQWNYEIIYNLHKFVDTEHAILIHADGYVIRPDLWREEFLSYDYIGAPWPLPTDDYSYRSESGKIQRVGNSVSLRSKRLMELVATREWKAYYGNTNEDGFICCHNREWLEEQGMRFAPLEVAVHFSKEHDIPENEGVETFAFHSL